MENVFKVEKVNWREGVLLSLTMGAMFILYFFHWKFCLPLHPNVDENITIRIVQQMLDGNGVLFRVFNYPHLAFYWGGLWCKIVSLFSHSVDIVLVLRIVECGFALLSNIGIYFSIKELTGSKNWAYAGLLIALCSLYQAQYLYYAGPDVMLYGVANITLYLGVKIYKEEDIQKVFHKWYPLMAVSIGLAMSAKYHGILFGFYWLMIHIVKKYAKSIQYNIRFALSCFFIVVTWLICNISLFFYMNDFFFGIFGISDNYLKNNTPPLVHSCPLLGYLEVFFLHNFGVFGILFSLFGIVYLLKEKNYRKLAFAILAMIILVFLILGNLNLMLGRNLSLIMPFSYLFITFGLYALGQQFAQLRIRVISITLLLLIMVGINIGAIIVSERYDESYQTAEGWIEHNIPENSTIYLKGGSYVPRIDENKYRVEFLDTKDLPDHLEANEYFIAVEYYESRWIQKKDYPFIFGDEYVKPDWAEMYLNKISKYTEIVSFPGITYEHGWRYRIGYFDIFKYNKNDYYIGPTIEIFAR